MRLVYPRGREMEYIAFLLQRKQALLLSSNWGRSPDCYPQVPKRPFFILVPALALVMALVRYFVIVLVDLLALNDHLEQIVVRIETIDLASLVFVK
jgi:hypothetical protein